MKHHLVLVFVFFLIPHFHCFAQKKLSQYTLTQLDSLLASDQVSTDPDKLLAVAQIGAEKAAKEFGEQDTIYAKMMFFIGFAHHKKDEFEQAEKYYKVFLEILKSKNKKNEHYALVLNNLGLVYLYTSQYEKAEAFFQDLMVLRKEISGENSAEYASNLNNLANVYYAVGRYQEAEITHQKVATIRKNIFGEKNALYASSINNLAILYDEMGRSVEAEPLYKKALTIFKEVVGEKDPEYAQVLNNLGVVYWGMENYTEAEALFRQALAIRKEVLGEQSLDYVASLYNMAVLYQEKKQYEHAEVLFQQTLALHKEIYGSKHPEYAHTLNNLALLYQEIGRYSEAIAMHKEALSIQKATLGPQHPNYLVSLNNLAAAYKNIKQYDIVVPLCKEVLESRKISLGTRHPKYLGSLNNIAELYWLLKERTTAWNYIQASINNNSQLQLSQIITEQWADSLSKAKCASISTLVETLALLAEILPQQHEKAIVATLALELLERIRNSFLNEYDKLRILEESAEWTLQGLKVLNKKTQADKAFLFAEQNKSVLLLESIQAEQAYSLGDLPDSLIHKELLLQQTYSELEASLLEEKTSEEKNILRSEFNSIGIQIRDFKQKIEKDYPQYAMLKYNQKSITVPKVQALLNVETALIEYVIGDSIVYIFYIDKQNINVQELSIPNQILTNNIKKLHQSLSDYTFLVKSSDEAYRKYIESAYWFYQNLLAPVLSKSKKIKNLVIVTDGELGHLPFEAFLVEPAPQVQTNYNQLHYLIKDYNISYNYSATLFAENMKAKSKAHNHQLFALSAFYPQQIDSTSSSYRLPVYQRLRTLLQPLPEAKKEVQILSETFQGFFGFDSISTEKVFKEKVSDFGIIHLAMHGLLDKNNPTLSSLAFTEDGDSTENNFLQAFEISKMKLNADLVVLSACETGYGRFERGNGIASLARAFMYAGVPSLVVSLWQVNDHSTAEIMRLFYSHLAAGMPKDAALRQAKLDYLNNTQGIPAHPAFWSAFVQLGDSRPISIKNKNSSSLSLLLGVLVVVAVGGFLIWRRRKAL